MNRKRVAIFLFGGVLVIGLLIVGYLQHTKPIITTTDEKALNCEGSAALSCKAGAESLNVSNSKGCKLGPNSAEKVRELDNVEAVNESTGIVTCKIG
jgi:hypothetical protein